MDTNTPTITRAHPYPQKLSRSKGIVVQPPYLGNVTFSSLRLLKLEICFNHKSNFENMSNVVARCYTTLETKEKDN